MSKTALLGLLICSLLWACSSAKKENSSGYYNNVPATQPAQAAPPQNDFLSGNGNGQKPVAPFMQTPAGSNRTVPGNQPVKVEKMSGATTVIPAQVQAATPPTGKGLNPPHGQPGHRCDISVGAPLNSKPAAATSPAITPQKITAAPPAVTVQKNPPVAATAPGMNPPHGQPGHRCDISVGAPLNSAPVKKDSQ